MVADRKSHCVLTKHKSRQKQKSSIAILPKNIYQLTQTRRYQRKLTNLVAEKQGQPSSLEGEALKMQF